MKTSPLNIGIGRAVMCLIIGILFELQAASPVHLQLLQLTGDYKKQSNSTLSQEKTFTTHASSFFRIIESGKCIWNSAIIINIYIAHLYGKIYTLVPMMAMEIYNVDTHGGSALAGN